MFQGVLRDEERQRRKKAARAAEFEEQAKRQIYLQTQQPVSHPSAPLPSLPAGTVVDAADIKFDGCKTCG
jgi:hypothetical protein